MREQTAYSALEGEDRAPFLTETGNKKREDGSSATKEKDYNTGKKKSTQTIRPSNKKKRESRRGDEVYLGKGGKRCTRRGGGKSYFRGGKKEFPSYQRWGEGGQWGNRLQFSLPVKKGKMRSISSPCLKED